MNVRELEDTLTELDLMIKNTKNLMDVVRQGRKALIEYRDAIQKKLQHLAKKRKEYEIPKEENKEYDIPTINETSTGTWIEIMNYLGQDPEKYLK